MSRVLLMKIFVLEGRSKLRKRRSRHWADPLRDEFPKVHSFSVLLEQLQKIYRCSPCVEDVLWSFLIMRSQTRYPGDYYPVTEEE